MNRKAQSQIITTVLIILLVLAAIIIVWQVVSNVINEGKKGIEESEECLNINLIVDSVVPTKQDCTIATCTNAAFNGPKGSKTKRYGRETNKRCWSAAASWAVYRLKRVRKN